MNPVSNAHGSLRLKLAETDVMVSGRVDLGVPDAETPLLGKVIFSVDW
jgi:exosome complex RNA-binding protein Rrp42 (RNase PH superfamily)